MTSRSRAITSTADLGTSRSTRWSCARCQVSVGRIDAGLAPMPSTWTQFGDLAYCLSCSRAMAGDAAMDAAPESISSEDRVRLRRKALIGFEIQRSPESPDRVIAGACHTSSKTVALVREELDGGLLTLAPALPRES